MSALTFLLPELARVERTPQLALWLSRGDRLPDAKSGRDTALRECFEFLGATMYAGLSAEIEFPIPVIPETYGLRGAVWADAAWIDGTPAFLAGSVDPDSVDQKFKSSIGASLIWNSPFGPLRGDFAYVLNKATSDRTQVFSLTLSTLL